MFSHGLIKLLQGQMDSTQLAVLERSELVCWGPKFHQLPQVLHLETQLYLDLQFDFLQHFLRFGSVPKMHRVGTDSQGLQTVLAYSCVPLRMAQWTE